MDDPDKTPEQKQVEADAAAAIKATEDRAAAAAAEKPAAEAKVEEKPVDKVEEKAPLRTDGPTLAEFVAAGYPEDKYPPAGYAAREPVVSNVAPTVTVDPQDPESAVKQHEAVDQRMADLNAHNEAGFAKIAEAEAAAVEASAAVPHVPTGKEWNKNTPVIDEFGNKQW